MLRGELSNIAVPELWIDSSVLFTLKEPVGVKKLLPGRVRRNRVEDERAIQWVERIREQVFPVQIIINKEYRRHQCCARLREFRSFEECRDMLAMFPNVLKMVTSDFNQVDGQHITAWDPAELFNAANQHLSRGKW